MWDANNRGLDPKQRVTRGITMIRLTLKSQKICEYLWTSSGSAAQQVDISDIAAWFVGSPTVAPSATF